MLAQSLEIASRGPWFLADRQTRTDSCFGWGMAARRYSRRDIHFEIWVSRGTRLMAGSGKMFVMHSASVSSNPCWTPTSESWGLRQPDQAKTSNEVED